MIKKYVLYIVIVLALSGLWLYDRHVQYNKGKEACQQEYLKQQLKSVPEAIAKADAARKETEQAKQSHEKTLVEIHEAASTNPCSFVSDELFILNRAIAEANNRSTRSTGKMSTSTTPNSVRR